mgnify:CR=1 FL=1
MIGGSKMQRLTMLRKEKGLSQRALSRESGVDASTISRAEKQALMYRSQAQNIADPMELFEEVEAA